MSLGIILTAPASHHKTAGHLAGGPDAASREAAGEYAGAPVRSYLRRVGGWLLWPCRCALGLAVLWLFLAVLAAVATWRTLRGQNVAINDTEGES
jgi:ABC-type uncharacterized transport system permease subunit